MLRGWLRSTSGCLQLGLDNPLEPHPPRPPNPHLKAFRDSLLAPMAVIVGLSAGAANRTFGVLRKSVELTISLEQKRWVPELSSRQCLGPP